MTEWTPPSDRFANDDDAIADIDEVEDFLPVPLDDYRGHPITVIAGNGKVRLFSVSTS